MVKLCVVHEEGAKRDEAAKQDPGGVTAPLLTTHRAIKNRAFSLDFDCDLLKPLDQ